MAIKRSARRRFFLFLVHSALDEADGGVALVGILAGQMAGENQTVAAVQIPRLLADLHLHHAGQGRQVHAAAKASAVASITPYSQTTNSPI